MANDHDFPRDEAERAWLAALPREAASPPDAEDRLVAELRRDRFRRRRWSVAPVVLPLAAALVVFAAGVLIGRESSNRDSMDWQLARTDMSAAERVFLLQRAGTYYARAMQRVVATAPDDSIAAEVTRQSLAAAALAAARARLDGGLAPTLVALLEAAPTAAIPPFSHVIWY
jgi:hypothetical protein